MPTICLLVAILAFLTTTSAYTIRNAFQEEQGGLVTSASTLNPAATTASNEIENDIRVMEEQGQYEGKTQGHEKVEGEDTEEIEGQAQGGSEALDVTSQETGDGYTAPPILLRGMDVKGLELRNTVDVHRAKRSAGYNHANGDVYGRVDRIDLAPGSMYSFIRYFTQGNAYTERGHYVQTYYTIGDYQEAQAHYKHFPTVKIAPHDDSRDNKGYTQHTAHYRVSLCYSCYHGFPKMDVVYEGEIAESYVVLRFVYIPVQYCLQYRRNKNQDNYGYNNRYNYGYYNYNGKGQGSKGRHYEYTSNGYRKPVYGYVKERYGRGSKGYGYEYNTKSYGGTGHVNANIVYG